MLDQPAARTSAAESNDHARTRAAVPVSRARADASRKNGARSRGPKTPEGKARSARNALKHGLRAEKYLVLPDEDVAEFAALEAALVEELAPEGALQSVLAGRIARAAWRLERAERLEVELFEERRYLDAGPGLALIRDGNATRSFDTLLRYRGAALAELMRSLRMLKALQGEAAARPSARALGTKAPLRLAAVRPTTVAPPSVPAAAHEQAPNEPGRRGDAREPARWGERTNPNPPRASDPGAARVPPPRPLGTPESAAPAQPSEPETRQPGEAAPTALRRLEVRSSDLRRARS
jgi:hypothetical protein